MRQSKSRNGLRQATLTLCAILIFVISALVSWSNPFPKTVSAQFVDRITRPCSGGVGGRSLVETTPTDILINPCAGSNVTINGVPLVIVPGGGLGDPGSNGYIVRTALNTTVARTFTTSGPVTVSNGSGVAGATVFGCTTCVTSAAALTVNQLVIGAGLQASAALGSLGITTTVLHGNAAGAPTFAAVALSTDVSGDLPFANLTQASAASKLLGRGSAAGAGDYQEITLGTNLSMSGTTLNAAGSSGTVTGNGTTNKLTLWSNGAGGVLADSPITASGNNVSLAGELAAALTIRTGTASNTDIAGSLTVGGGGTITYTFTQTYTTAPICVSSDTNAVPLISGASASTTVLTVTGTVGHVVTYQCIGLN